PGFSVTSKLPSGRKAKLHTFSKPSAMVVTRILAASVLISTGLANAAEVANAIGKVSEKHSAIRRRENFMEGSKWLIVGKCDCEGKATADSKMCRQGSKLARCRQFKEC